MVAFSELSLNVLGSMDETFLQQCIVLSLSALLENNGFRRLPKLYSRNRWVFVYLLGHVRIGWC